jgi:hypothetical protein
MTRVQVDEFSTSALALMDAVREVPNESFRKVLYLVMIDGLSSMRYRRTLSPSERFEKFVRNYARWDEAERVSLPQAKLYIEAYGGSSGLHSRVSLRLNEWQRGRIYDLTNDPLPRELPTTQEVLRACQHFRLLWALRNSLIHGFRHPAFALDHLTGNGDNAFYHGEIDSTEWRLAYPDGFIRRLASNCLQGLVAWLREQGNRSFPALSRGLWVDRPAKRKKAEWQWLLIPSAFVVGLIVGAARRS